MIDENVADIVRMVFDKFVNEEWSEYKIAKYLLNHHSYKWTPDLVRRMLEIQEYAGNTVNFKTEGISFKTKNHVKIPKENWLIFKNTHPAIISREDFKKVQEKLKTIRKNAWNRDNSEKYDTFFRRKCICDMCQGSMHRGINYEKLYYQCQNYRLHRSCNLNYITENYLHQIVADYLKRLYFAVKSDRNSILEKLGLTELQMVETEIISAENRVQKINSLQKELYEKYFHGDLSAEEFKKLSESHTTEKENLLQTISNIMWSTVIRLS